MQRFLIIGLVLLILVVGGSTLFLNIAGKLTTWNTTQSALSVCQSDTKTAVLDLTFSNNGVNSISVSAKDSQTGKTVSLGAIPAHQEKTGLIETNKADIQGGTVTFTLSQGFVSTKKSVFYAAVTGCADINASPTGTMGNPTPTENSHLPATGSPLALWVSLLAGIPAGYFFKKFAKKS